MYYSHLQYIDEVINKTKKHYGVMLRFLELSNQESNQNAFGFLTFWLVRACILR